MALISEQIDAVMQIFTQKKFKGEILMYIPNIQVMPLVQKGKKINSLMEEKSMITQNSTATINNLDGTYITVLMAQLVWAPFPTDSKSESERNNFCNHFEKICETLTEKCSQDDEDALVVYDSIPKYARYLFLLKCSTMSIITLYSQISRS